MKAFISGVDGQDGSYLAELLLSKGYEVHGLIRRGVNTPQNIEHIRSKLHLHYGDMATENQLALLVDEIKPDEIYNLAGQSDVKISFEIPEYTGDVTGLGVTRLLEAIRHFSPHSKLYQASSSEMFGNAPPPQNEKTPLRARSPYGAAKIYGHNIVIVYRESYGIFGCNGILFNHESERRGLNFVTRKISHAVASIYLGKQEKLELGNIAAYRDWGYAPDYVKAMWMMLQQEKPDDYVIGTGRTHTVCDFVCAAFKVLGMDWTKYTIANTANVMRPGEVNYLLADATKARTKLGWKPETSFEKLVRIMVKHDLKELQEAK
jgi:GDPmannose 4,6-dehydratase